jgi:hypothetical protein
MTASLEGIARDTSWDKHQYQQMNYRQCLTAQAVSDSPLLLAVPIE